MNYFTGKNILIISPEPWGVSMVSKHHYAETLARLGNSVWFLNPPGATFNTSELVHQLDDKFHVRGTRFLPSFLQRIILRYSARKISAAAGVTFDVVWSFDNSRHYHLDQFKASLAIHHVVDIDMNFHLGEAASSADICLSSNFEILGLLKVHQERVYFIQHGFAPDKKIPAALPTGKGEAKIVYAGNLCIPFINWPLIRKLVESNPECDFYFIGASGGGNLNRGKCNSGPSTIEELKQMENVFFLGERSPGELNTLLAQADVLLICYDHVRYPAQVANAHKVMTYLASGKVVVSNVMDLYRTHSILEMADDADSYLRLFSHVRNNLSLYNSADYAQRRIEFAMDNTYEKQIARIEALTEKLA